MAKSAHISSIFLCVAILCLSKKVTSEQISSHFRLKTKSQDEFNALINIVKETSNFSKSCIFGEYFG